MKMNFDVLVAGGAEEIIKPSSPGEPRRESPSDTTN